jgi:uncharacterized protein (TIGR03067 family)
MAEVWMEDHPVVVLTHSDLDRLQGRWSSVSGRRQADFHIEGRTFLVRFHDGDTYTGALDVVIDEWPRTMVMCIADGPEKHKGKTALCIYELDGDTLRWCPAEPGADDPLPDFPAVEDTRHLCMIFRRSVESDANPMKPR